MKKRVFMFLMISTLICASGCGEKKQAKENSVFDPKKESSIGKEDEEESEEDKQKTTVETTQAKDSEGAVSNITVDEVTDYIYSNGYNPIYDFTEVAEVQLFASFIDDLKDDFYWYDQSKEVEVMALEYEDGSMSDTFYNNYQNFSGSVRVAEGQDGEVRYGAVFTTDLKIFIYYAALENSFLMMSEPYATELTVIDDFSSILHIDFTISEEDLSALEAPKTVVREIGGLSVSFTFNSNWKVDDSTSEEQIIVYMSDDVEMDYTDSLIQINDSEAIMSAFEGYSDASAFTANGRDCFYGMKSINPQNRLYTIYEDIGANTYLKINVMIFDENINFEDEILSLVLLNV